MSGAVPLALLLWVVGLGSAAGVALALPARPGLRPPRSGADVVVQGSSAAAGESGLLRRGRAVWAAVSALGVAVVLGGIGGVVGGVVVGAVVWVVATRAEPPGVRRRREEAVRGLPHLVGLLAAALEAGAAPDEAVRLVARALPGAASDRLAPVAQRLAWGGDPGEVWGELASDAALGPLGRTMARAHASGAPVALAVERLGDDLAAAARADVEDRARAVGVKAAVPLGVCLLPAFLLVGIVPLVAGLLTSLRW